MSRASKGGASTDAEEAERDKVCEERDAIFTAIEAKGWCYGEPGETITAYKVWTKCPPKGSYDTKTHRYVLFTPPEGYEQITSPGFSCSTSLQPIERLICDTPQLSRADGVLGAVYRDALKSHPAKADSIKTEQRAWLKDIKETCDVKQLGKPEAVICLTNEYQVRVAELRRSN